MRLADWTLKEASSETTSATAAVACEERFAPYRFSLIKVWDGALLACGRRMMMSSVHGAPALEHRGHPEKKRMISRFRLFLSRPPYFSDQWQHSVVCK